MIEWTLGYVKGGKLQDQSQADWNQDLESDNPTDHDRNSPCLHPSVLHDEQVPQRGDEERQEETVESNEDVQEEEEDSTANDADIVFHRKQKMLDHEKYLEINKRPLLSTTIELQQMKANRKKPYRFGHYRPLCNSTFFNGNGIRTHIYNLLITQHCLITKIVKDIRLNGSLFYQKWRMSDETDDVVCNEEFVDGRPAAGALLHRQLVVDPVVDVNADDQRHERRYGDDGGVTSSKKRFFFDVEKGERRNFGNVHFSSCNNVTRCDVQYST